MYVWYTVYRFYACIARGGQGAGQGLAVEFSQKNSHLRPRTALRQDVILFTKAPFCCWRLKPVSTYGGKLIIFTAQVLNIQDDHIQLGDSSYINVYLPAEDIMQIEEKQLITVVGQLGDTIEEVEEDVGYGMTASLYCYEMPQAYLVADRFEYTGILKWKNESREGAWDIEYNGDPVLKQIYFNESVDLSGFDESYCNEEITFTAKVLTPNYSNPGSFLDAIIVETGK